MAGKAEGSFSVCISHQWKRGTGCRGLWSLEERLVGKGVGSAEPTPL
jgi:hypothetical protein